MNMSEDTDKKDIDEDEEVSIDFSKIKNLFKKKKKSTKESADTADKSGKEISKEKEVDKEENKGDEEVSIDFSKIKNLFRKKPVAISSTSPEKEIKTLKTEPEEDDEDISIDLSKIKKFFKKKSADTNNKKPVKTETDKSKLEEKEDEEIGIDLSKIKAFFKKGSEKVIEKAKSEEKEDEEISLDFSRIKKLFREKETEKKDEELVDFSELKKAFNIKKLFKGEEREIKKEPEHAKSEMSDVEDVQFDIKKIASVINKKKWMLLPAVLLVIAIIISIHVRIQNIALPLTDVWARDSVSNYYKNQIRGNIEQRYPNLPDTNKDALIDTEYQKFLQEKSSEIAEQTRQTSIFFKSKFQDENGDLYMPDIDPYYWFRYARNIVEHGYIGDEIRDNKQFDNHMVAPLGSEIQKQDIVYPYLLVYFYKFVKIFDSNISLMNSMLYFPVIISALTLIPIFFIGRRIGGNLAGFSAALITGVSAMLVNKTLFGHADTDAIVIFFPVYATWFFLSAIESKGIIKMIILSSLSGIFLGLYDYVWSGWWYIFDFILLSVIIYIFFSLVIFIKKNKSIKGYIKKSGIKNLLIALIFLCIFTGIFVTKKDGFIGFLQAPIQPLLFTSFKEAVHENLWPNVLTTVAELKEASISEIISEFGGRFYFLIALIGIILILLGDMDKKQLILLMFSIIWFAVIMSDYVLGINLIIFLVLLIVPLIVGILLVTVPEDISKIKTASLLMIWLISGIYASTKGIRFSIIIAPAFGIAFGVTISRIVGYFSQMLNKELNISRLISSLLMIVIVSLLYIKPIQASYNMASVDVPLINDAWYNALTFIKSNSTKSAIITSWWDFGHHFKAIADRSVTFDGASQATPPAHWVGSMLLNSDEKIAVGILRMLNCGSTSAFDELDKVIKDTEKSVEILYQIMGKDEDESRMLLNANGLKEDEIDKIMNYTFCKNPTENFLITSEDMVSKAPVWGHFGSWDFKRALAYNTLTKPEYGDSEKAINFLQDRLNYSSENAENLYFEITTLRAEDVNNWVSPWPIYTSMIPCEKVNNGSLRCGNIMVNLTSYDTQIITPSGIMYPKIAVFPIAGGYIKKEYNESLTNLQNERPMGITLIPGEVYSILPADYILSDSIFTKLFYLDGHGLKNFRKFYQESSVLGNNIIVWRVDWTGNTTNDIFKVNQTLGSLSNFTNETEW